MYKRRNTDLYLFLQWPKEQEKEEEIMEEAQKCQRIMKDQFLVNQGSTLSS